MAEHLSDSQLIGYGAKTLDSEELLAADRHLASCDVCHDRLTHLSPKTFDLSIEEPFHLDYDEHVAPYVDGAANDIDREIVESHIALCSQCEKDIRDLQEFRQQPVPSSPDERVRHWTASMGQGSRGWNPQRTAALVIAVFIIGIIPALFLWTRSRTLEPAHEAGPASLSGADKQTGREPTSAGPSPEHLATQPSPDAHANEPEQPLVALNDGGHHVTLDERGQSTGLELLPLELRRTVETVLATRKLRKSPALGNLTEGIARLRGQIEQQDTIVPLDPVGVVI